MKEQRYWLSFDLGLGGNYEDLYEWLDSLGARECADSMATFRSSKSREEITEELARLLGSDKKSRAYIIDMKRGGRFILGKRKAPPWAGYSSQAVEVEEEQ